MDFYELHPGGKLVKCEWNSQLTSYDEFDVTDNSPRYLWEDIRIAEDVTLNDIFLLLNSNLDFFDTIFGNYCKEYVEEALNNEAEPDDEFSHVEVYYDLRILQDWKNTNHSVFGGHLSPEFSIMCKDGTEQDAESIPVYKIKKLPLKLRPNVDLFNEKDFYASKDFKNPNKYLQEFDKIHYTLGGILRSITFEISAFGNPKNRETVLKGLNNKIQDRASDLSDSIPFDELMEEIKANIRERE